MPSIDLDSFHYTEVTGFGYGNTVTGSADYEHYTFDVSAYTDAQSLGAHLDFADHVSMHGSYGVAEVDGNSIVDMSGGYFNTLKVRFNWSESDYPISGSYTGQHGHADKIDFTDSVLGLEINLFASQDSIGGLSGSVQGSSSYAGQQNPATFTGFNEIYGSYYGDVITIENCNGYYESPTDNYLTSTYICTNENATLGSTIAISNADGIHIGSSSIYDSVVINNELYYQKIGWDTTGQAAGAAPVDGQASILILAQNNCGILSASMGASNDLIFAQAGDQTTLDIEIYAGNHRVELVGEQAYFDFSMDNSSAAKRTTLDIVDTLDLGASLKLIDFEFAQDIHNIHFNLESVGALSGGGTQLVYDISSSDQNDAISLTLNFGLSLAEVGANIQKLNQMLTFLGGDGEFSVNLVDSGNNLLQAPTLFAAQ